MTDNEIIKALECRVKDKCPECPYFHSYPCDKCRNMQTDALDLINRQKEEIERLKGISDNKTKELLRYNASIEELHKKLETAKAEAYKEFSERVKKLPYYPSYTNLHKAVDNLLKEIIGE